MEIVWHGSSRDDLMEFPDDAKSDAGYQLYRVQTGEEPSNWKPMSSIGQGVKEIRIFESTGTYRVIYVVESGETLHVLHAFQKKSEKTSRQDINLVKSRLKEI